MNLKRKSTVLNQSNPEMDRVAVSSNFRTSTEPYIQEEILDTLWHDCYTCKYCGYNAIPRGVYSHYRLEHTQEILDEIKKRPELQEISNRIGTFLVLF